MISHKHKCIFIHIPKTAGMSIYNFFHPDVYFYQDVPNYDILFGWCPKRQMHLQHATAKQLLETELITEEQWKMYYKFTFVRNPWDRAYSDYLYIQQFAGIKDSFVNFMLKHGKFKSILSDNTNCHYMGDHLELQSSFFNTEGSFKPDFIGHFENFKNDIQSVLNEININREFNIKTNQSKNRLRHYSMFYTNTKKELVSSIYKQDIELFNYAFEDSRDGLYNFKRYF